MSICKTNDKQSRRNTKIIESINLVNLQNKWHISKKIDKNYGKYDFCQFTVGRTYMQDGKTQKVQKV